MSESANPASVQSGVIQISVNGQPRETPALLTVSSLLAWLEIKPDRVAIELNKSIVRKRDWHNTQIFDGAQLEIVEFVGGG